MIIENILLNFVHIYGELPAYEGRRDVHTKSVAHALLEDQVDDRLKEYFCAVVYSGPNIGKAKFSARSMRRCPVIVEGGMYKTLGDMLACFDVANIDRNLIFKTGPVTLEVERGEYERNDTSNSFIHLSKMIVDVDKLDIYKVLK
ncbi:hypothetical protein Ab1vBOLIVR4_gp53 [Agrobacterium phage OLIVR4]|nr:hypothetical protein Ab1vBOLIVR4_gp53 [Agrobacterium phage OLIVR4]